MIPLVRIIQGYIRKRNNPNYGKSPEKRVGMQFERADTIEKPVRNLARPETKDMLVLGEQRVVLLVLRLNSMLLIRDSKNTILNKIHSFTRNDN
jgi:hypothetical protein